MTASSLLRSMSMTKERSTLSSATGNWRKRASEEWPVPKSSIEHSISKTRQLRQHGIQAVVVAEKDVLGNLDGDAATDVIAINQAAKFRP